MAEKIPDVLWFIIAATAVTGSGSSLAKAGAIVSWKDTPKSALPDATRASAPFAGGWFTSTSIRQKIPCPLPHKVLRGLHLDPSQVKS